MWFVIGISGVTCSGKTSLATRLGRAIPESQSVNQDKYFLPESSERHVLVPEFNHMNWELLTSMDMEAMLRDIAAIIATPTQSSRVLIVEGHTIFNYAPIAALCHLKFYMTLTREQCWARRQLRSYEPPDVPGYFDKIVWPEAERHRSEMMQQVEEIRLLDGTVEQDLLEQTVADAIQELIQVSSCG